MSTLTLTHSLSFIFNESIVAVFLIDGGVLFQAAIPLAIKLFLEIDLLNNGIWKLPISPLLVFDNFSLAARYSGIFEELMRQTWRT